MTQKALAEASKTTQATVSRVEAGVHEPHAATVSAWAAALRYPVAFFERRSDAPPLPHTFWRKQAKLGKTDQKEIEARIAINCLCVQALLRSVDVSEADAPGIKVGIQAKSAADAAKYMRSYWRLPTGPIEDLVRVAEANGIMVVMLPSTPGFQGVSIRDSRKELPPIVFVSADDPMDRQRWTIAHEIGHILLHHHQRVLDLTEDEIEDEADAFAGEFLMPAHEIRPHFSWKTHLPELAQLKLHWRVSMAALLRRGKDLERISETHATRLWKIMSKAGYRRGGEPNEPPKEEPTMLRELLRVHVEDLGYAEEELAMSLALDLEDLRRDFLDHVTPSTDKREAPPSKPRLHLVK